MNHQIAVIAGGDSSEFQVSVRSGINLFNAIDRTIYDPWLLHLQGERWQLMEGDIPVADVDKSDFSWTINGHRIRPDFAYITIHGTPGEDGILQGYFELLRIPYSTCNVQVSALTFNKWHCSNFLRSFGVTMAASVKLNRGVEFSSKDLVHQLGLPLFVKPNAGGSSFGITKVKDEASLAAAVEHAWSESSEALIESFVDGREYTCGVARLDGEVVAFPVTEVIPKNEFFDFEAKYTPGATDEITPARLPAEQYEACQSLSRSIYEWCGCDGIVRIDYILFEGKFYFLEVNTTPGMTSTSFIPQQIAAMGTTLGKILTKLIDERLKKRE